MKNFCTSTWKRDGSSLSNRIHLGSSFCDASSASGVRSILRLKQPKVIDQPITDSISIIELDVDRITDT